MRTLFLVAFLLISSNAHALKAGELAFTAFNADAEYFAFTAWADIEANSTLNFTDNTWARATQSFNSSEGWLSWSSNTRIAAGQIIVIHNASRQSNLGSIGAYGGTFGLSASGESLYAYTGSLSAPTSILAALSTEGTSSLSGLPSGASLIQLPSSTDYADYTGPRSGITLSEARSLLANSSQWTGSTSGDDSLLTANTSAFTLSPVPEPASAATLLTGLSLLSLIARRRKH